MSATAMEEGTTLAGGKKLTRARWRFDITTPYHTIPYHTILYCFILYNAMVLFVTTNHQPHPQLDQARLCGPGMNCIWWKQLRCKFGMKIQIQIETKKDHKYGYNYKYKYNNK